MNKTVVFTLPNGDKTQIEYSDPVLVGSEKQIAFAADLLRSHETIRKIVEMRARAEWIKSAPDADKWARRGWSAEKCDSEIAGANAALAQTSAAYWIDNFDAIVAVRNPYIR